ncbi:NPCBM/NEW2 domain-containing protein [Streptomyces tendae]|uniref:NPCBM/NEW2 domain-containing protein n=1 Tax=Streptomyces tendae TaxID=1932 RepID=UPI003F4A7754
MHHIGPDSAPDRYRLLNAIGRGGEAVLYRATIELDGEPETVVVPDGTDEQCSGTAEYNLGREWKNLTMTAGVSDVSANTSSRVEVYVDGESLFTGQVDLGKPRELKLKVENGLRLRIAYSDPEDSCEMGDLLLADPTLTR